MENCKILIRKSAAKEFESLPEPDLQREIARIQSLATNPRPTGAEKLAGNNRYRIRQRNDRIIYSIQDNELTV